MHNLPRRCSFLTPHDACGELFSRSFLSLVIFRFNLSREPLLVKYVTLKSIDVSKWRTFIVSTELKSVRVKQVDSEQPIVVHYTVTKIRGVSFIFIPFHPQYPVRKKTGEGDDDDDDKTMTMMIMITIIITMMMQKD